MNVFCKMLLLVTILASAAVAAGPVRDIALTDGSVVSAEVISLDNGIYTLRSDTLGDMQIPAAKIESIATREQTSTASASEPSANANIESLREAFVQDPNTMVKIQMLQNDPLVMDILNDEATMRAINAGDLGTLMNDPKIKALMDHSTVQEITRSGGL